MLSHLNSEHCWADTPRNGLLKVLFVCEAGVLISIEIPFFYSLLHYLMNRFVIGNLRRGIAKDALNPAWPAVRYAFVVLVTPDVLTLRRVQPVFFRLERFVLRRAVRDCVVCS